MTDHDAGSPFHCDNREKLQQGDRWDKFLRIKLK